MKTLTLLAVVLTAHPDICPNCGTDLSEFIAQQGIGDDVTAPEWVVIFDVPPERETTPPGPLINLRVVLRADREGQAILKATRLVQLMIDGRAFERLKFIEAQQRAPKADK
jgi:hypothetical protein